MAGEPPLPPVVALHPVPITGLWLVRERDERGAEFDMVEVRIEHMGQWYRVVREPISGLFSRIIEPSGIRRAMANPPWTPIR